MIIEKNLDQLSIATIRTLSMNAIEQAKSTQILKSLISIRDTRIMHAYEQLNAEGIKARVGSMPS